MSIELKQANPTEVLYLRTTNSEYRMVLDQFRDEFDLQKKLEINGWSPIWVTIMVNVDASCMQVEEARHNIWSFFGFHPENGRSTKLTTSPVRW